VALEVSFYTCGWLARYGDNSGRTMMVDKMAVQYRLTGGSLLPFFSTADLPLLDVVYPNQGYGCEQRLPLRNFLAKSSGPFHDKEFDEGDANIGTLYVYWHSNYWNQHVGGRWSRCREAIQMAYSIRAVWA